MPTQENPYAPPQSPPAPSPMPAATRTYAPCPSCGSGFATPVGFTLWGGILGPKMLTHVTCTQCKTSYNGKTGKSNNTAIAIYIAVSCVLGLALGLLVFGLG